MRKHVSPEMPVRPPNLPRATVALLNKARFSLAFGDHEMVVIAVGAPRTGRNIPHFDKLPVGYIGRPKA